MRREPALPRTLPVGVAVGDRAPAFRVVDVQGGDAAVPAGRPTVLLFGAASGCASCAGSEQQMASLYRRYGNRVQFVTVDLDPADTPAVLRQFARQFGGPWPHVLADRTGLVGLYRVTSVDTLMVLGRHGRVLARSDYGLSTGTLTRLLTAHAV